MLSFIMSVYWSWIQTLEEIKQDMITMLVIKSHKYGTNRMLIRFHLYFISLTINTLFTIITFSDRININNDAIIFSLIPSKNVFYLYLLYFLTPSCEYFITVMNERRETHAQIKRVLITFWSNTKQFHSERVASVLWLS